MGLAPPLEPNSTVPESGGSEESAESAESAESVESGRSERRLHFAAGVGCLMITLSGSVALYTGWQLAAGDHGSELMEALPSRCDLVVVAGSPRAVVSLLRAADELALPEALTGVVAGHAARLAEALGAAAGAPAGADPEGAWAGCARDGGVFATVAVRGSAEAAIDGLAAQLEAVVGPGLGVSARWRSGERLPGLGRWLVGDDGRVRVALQANAGRVQVAWSFAGDAAALLEAGLADLDSDSLADNHDFRAALERGGGGALQLYISGALLASQAAAASGGLFDADAMTSRFDWLGASLREIDDHVDLHVHLGAGQRGVMWLKEHLDITTPTATTAILPATAAGGGVLRLRPAGWLGDLDALRSVVVGRRALAAIEAYLGRSLDDLLRAAGGEVFLIVAPASAGPARIALAVTGPGAPKAPFRATEQDLPLIVRHPSGGEDWLAEFVDQQAPRLASRADLATEIRTALDDDGGLFLDAGARFAGLAGPLSLRWVWADSGLALHCRLGRRDGAGSRASNP